MLNRTAFRALAAVALNAFALLPSAAAQPVTLGIDNLAKQEFLPVGNRRVGLITNPSGVTRDLRATADLLAGARGVKLVALFGPEHGVRGDVPAGQKIDDARDALTGLPVRSLYGKTRRPTPEMLADIDMLVIDIQDIGVRSYTFISTLALAMDAAAENGKEVVVLDRPNPLGGLCVEGRALDPAFSSFVGQLPISYIHGMTMGELAQMIRGEKWTNSTTPCKLTVIPMLGWKRSMTWEQTGLTWVPTSPHIPHARTAAFYAATGIMGELGVMSEGVGYPLPFELAGAPGLDPRKFADELSRRRLPGVAFRPAYFRPFYGRFKDETCGGVQVLLTDAGKAELSIIAFHTLDALRTLEPNRKLFGADRDTMFDRVCGTDQIRTMFVKGKPIDDIVAYWRGGVDEFARKREKYLMYP
jgi:uncharacterized protein YbbC (DUF1343 family)